MEGQLIFILLVGFGLLLLAFVIFRELACWYWKINERIELLTEIKKIGNMILIFQKLSSKT